MVFYFDSYSSTAANQISSKLSSLMDGNRNNSKKIIMLCIGSDRVSGDSLGPIIGYKLSYYENKPFEVIGSLCTPVHGTNLPKVIESISLSYDKPYIIAIDASLGTPAHVGYITVGTGHLKPGLGVKKKLPEVGDIHITGIVNNSNFKDKSFLSTTRLYTIMHLADVITISIARSFNLKPCSYMMPTPEQLSGQAHFEELSESPPAFQGQ